MALTPLERLADRHLEAVHTQRIEWKKQRLVLESLGIYQDFRAVFTEESVPRNEMIRAAKNAEVQVVVSTGRPGLEDGVQFLSKPDGFRALEIPHSGTLDPQRWLRVARRQKEWAEELFGAATEADAEALARWDAASLKDKVGAFASVSVPPDGIASRAVALRNTSTHILAQSLSAEDLTASLKQGHMYFSHDWLCDPTGFRFLAENILGVYEIGDEIGLAGPTTIHAGVSVPAELKLIRNGETVAQSSGTSMDFAVKEVGTYRLEAWLRVDGEARPWIFSNPIYVRQPPELVMPQVETPPGVAVYRDLAYVEAGDAKQKLDLYIPKDDTKKLPTLLFLHGGSWTGGDRSLYNALGTRLARAGIAVAIPSYRLMPANPHPVQAEDVAAAVDWVYRNIERYGGDPSRLYLAGHSAGGHLAALVALDPKYLAKSDLDPSMIRGVISMSGVYDVSRMIGFKALGDIKDASPLLHVHGGAPRFLISYSQWDFAGFPKQARDFSAALRKAFVDSRLLYLGGENHVTEILNVAREQDPLLDAILSFIE
jgi:acetyl esterase/lipase